LVAALLLFGAAPLVAQETSEASPDAKTSQGHGFEMSEYWLGVLVSRPNPALQTQLDLPKDQGLVVDVVQPGSPADKAGLRPFDVLLKANDRVLREPRDLVAEITAVKEGKLTVELVRGGKRQTVTATTAKRPAEARAELFGQRGADSDALREWLQQMAPALAEGRPLEFRYFHPGQILPPGAAMPGRSAVDMELTIHSKLPNGYEVEIVGDGRKPAHITVTHEKQQWKATEGELASLPEEVRPMVQSVLNKVPWGYRILADEPLPTLIAPPVRAVAGGKADRIEQQIGDLNAKVEQLRKSLDELRMKMDAAPSAPAKPSVTLPPKPQPPMSKGDRG
jgi:hypothetical protein